MNNSSKVLLLALVALGNCFSGEAIKPGGPGGDDPSAPRTLDIMDIVPAFAAVSLVESKMTDCLDAPASSKRKADRDEGLVSGMDVDRPINRPVKRHAVRVREFEHRCLHCDMTFSYGSDLEAHIIKSHTAKKSI